MAHQTEQPLPDEWVKVFDDMVLVQQRTEAERDALRAEVERLKTERAEWTWRINDGARSAKQIVEWLRHRTCQT